MPLIRSAFLPAAAASLLGTVACTSMQPRRTALNHPSEGRLEAFLGPSQFSVQQVFPGERFPNVVVTLDGAVVAISGTTSVRARRSLDAGRSWGEEIAIAPAGIHGGGALVDEGSGALFAFVEASHPPAPLTVFRSVDGGLTWNEFTTSIRPDSRGHLPSMHMNEAGTTLRRGPYAGRLIRAARYYGAGNRSSEWPNHYTTSIFSDDGGRTWQTGAPFPEQGTGEAGIVELADGSLYYNSRVHWPEAPSPTRRRSARSTDGGASWHDHQIVMALPDGRQDRAYGCMGGLIRLPVWDRDILVFSNLDTPRDQRERLTVWVSFDGGRSWPRKRLVAAGPSGYSSLAAGRPETGTEGQIFCHFEGGPGGGLKVARFNLAWVLGGSPTGDGDLPEGLPRSD